MLGGGGAMQHSSVPEQYLNAQTSVWWDIHNCPVPEACDPRTVQRNICSALRRMNYSGFIKIFIHADPDKLPMSVFSVIGMVTLASNDPKTVSDGILTRMIRWARNNPPPANYLLISGDRDFTYGLQQLRARGYNILLAQSPNTCTPIYKDATSIWLWTALCDGDGGPPIGQGDDEPAQTINNNMGQTLVLDSDRRYSNKVDVDISQDVFRGLQYRLSPEKNAFITPEKGKTSIVLLIGLLGSRTTSTCIKYAYYHKNKGWKPALVCAYTSRDGVLDELKQNATKAGIPFYDRYTESDPVRTLVEGIERFKKENCDLIIVDTGFIHKPGVNSTEEVDRVTEEIDRVSEATKLDLVIFAADNPSAYLAVAQCCESRYKTRAAVDAVSVVKMNEHYRGYEVVYATSSRYLPVIFVETGEHLDEFEAFDVKQIVSLLLGKCDWIVFMDKFTLRMMHAKYKKIDQILCSTHSSEFPSEMAMLESMTNEEFDGTNPNRIMQIAYKIWSTTSACEECTRNEKRVSKPQNNLEDSVESSSEDSDESSSEDSDESCSEDSDESCSEDSDELSTEDSDE